LVARDSDFAYLAEKILLTRWEDELIETWLFYLDCKVSTHPPQSLGRMGSSAGLFGIRFMQ
jgi:hypothetical protein